MGYLPYQLVSRILPPNRMNHEKPMEMFKMCRWRLWFEGLGLGTRWVQGHRCKWGEDGFHWGDLAPRSYPIPETNSMFLHLKIGNCLPQKEAGESIPVPSIFRGYMYVTLVSGEGMAMVFHPI